MVTLADKIATRDAYVVRMNEIDKILHKTRGINRINALVDEWKCLKELVRMYNEEINV